MNYIPNSRQHSCIFLWFWRTGSKMDLIKINPGYQCQRGCVPSEGSRGGSGSLPFPFLDAVACLGSPCFSMVRAGNDQQSFLLWHLPNLFSCLLSIIKTILITLGLSGQPRVGPNPLCSKDSWLAAPVPLCYMTHCRRFWWSGSVHLLRSIILPTLPPDLHLFFLPSSCPLVREAHRGGLLKVTDK